MSLEETNFAEAPMAPPNIMIIFGAGGDRDRTKRPLMGKVAENLAKRVYVTSDNPRTEDPHAILRAIEPGVAKHLPAGEADGRRILFGDRQTCDEERISHCLAHHASTPVGPRLDGRMGGQGGRALALGSAGGILGIGQGDEDRIALAQWPASIDDDRPRAASPVNILGQVLGDATAFRVVNSGATVKLERAE